MAITLITMTNNNNDSSTTGEEISPTTTTKEAPEAATPLGAAPSSSNPSAVAESNKEEDDSSPTTKQPKLNDDDTSPTTTNDAPSQTPPQQVVVVATKQQEDQIMTTADPRDDDALEAIQSERLRQAVEEAGRWSYGIVQVEVWAQTEDKTALFRPLSGWWIDPSMTVSGAHHHMRNDTNSAAITTDDDGDGDGDDNDNRNEDVVSYHKLVDPSHKDYVPCKPVAPGQGLAGVLWSEVDHFWGQNQRLAWRKLEKIIPRRDPKKQCCPRLRLMMAMGMGWCAAMPFHRANQKGIIVYVARESVDLGRLKAESNQEYLRSASDLIAAAFVFGSFRRKAIRERRSELGSSLQRASTEILKVHRDGHTLRDLERLAAAREQRDADARGENLLQRITHININPFHNSGLFQGDKSNEESSPGEADNKDDSQATTEEQTTSDAPKAAAAAEAEKDTKNNAKAEQGPHLLQQLGNLNPFHHQADKGKEEDADDSEQSAKNKDAATEESATDNPEADEEMDKKGESSSSSSPHLLQRMMSNRLNPFHHEDNEAAHVSAAASEKRDTVDETALDGSSSSHHDNFFKRVGGIFNSDKSIPLESDNDKKGSQAMEDERTPGTPEAVETANNRVESPHLLQRMSNLNPFHHHQDKSKEQEQPSEAENGKEKDTEDDGSKETESAANKEDGERTKTPPGTPKAAASETANKKVESPHLLQRMSNLNPFHNQEKSKEQPSDTISGKESKETEVEHEGSKETESAAESKGTENPNHHHSSDSSLFQRVGGLFQGGSSNKPSEEESSSDPDKKDTGATNDDEEGAPHSPTPEEKAGTTKDAAFSSPHGQFFKRVGGIIFQPGKTGDADNEADADATDKHHSSSLDTPELEPKEGQQRNHPPHEQAFLKQMGKNLNPFHRPDNNGGNKANAEEKAANAKASDDALISPETELQAKLKNVNSVPPHEKFLKQMGNLNPFQQEKDDTYVPSPTRKKKKAIKEKEVPPHEMLINSMSKINPFNNKDTTTASDPEDFLKDAKSASSSSLPFL